MDRTKNQDYCVQIWKALKKYEKIKESTTLYSLKETIKLDTIYFKLHKEYVYYKC